MPQKTRARDHYARARSQAEKGDRKQKILSAATDIVLAGKLDEFTIGSLAQESGVAKGTIYLYFKTKTDVFHQLFVEELAAWSDAVVEKSHGEMTDAEFAAIFWSCTCSDGVLMRLLSTPAAWGSYPSADRATQASRTNLRILDDVIHLAEDCLDLPNGAGSFLMVSLFAHMIGSAQMDLAAVRPALAQPPGCNTGISQKTIFLQNAPAIIAASRTYHPPNTAVASLPEPEVTH
jgi:AcrR family transcriptional regulator